MTQAQIDAYRKDNPDCQMCGRSRTVAVHHIIFRSQQGTDESENLITLCDPWGCKGHPKGHGKIWKKDEDGKSIPDIIPAEEFRMIKELDELNPGNC